MEQKSLIHQFDPTIYPRLLWVVKGGSHDYIHNAFSDYNGDKLLIPDDYKDRYGAMVFRVKMKSNKRLGNLVWLVSKKDVDTIAHESVHVASNIFSDCNIAMGFNDGQDEHFAYLVGFVADCLWQVVTGRFRN